MELIRLDKFISGQMPEYSRNDVKQLCRRGRVAVNGAAAKSADMKIDAHTANVTVEGKTVCYKKNVYIMLNKPIGVVCSTRDGLSKTVLELLPKNLLRQGLFPAGRLDKDTEGFVLITDDGELAHKMLSPKSHVPKRYFVRLEHDICPDAERIFKLGITIDGGEKCLPAELELTDSANECYLTLHEGMYHQVKRMFEALGNRVVYLKRVKIGGVELDPKLELSKVRELTPEEIQKLILS